MVAIPRAFFGVLCVVLFIVLGTIGMGVIELHRQAVKIEDQAEAIKIQAAAMEQLAITAGNIETQDATLRQHCALAQVIVRGGDLSEAEEQALVKATCRS